MVKVKVKEGLSKKGGVSRESRNEQKYSRGSQKTKHIFQIMKYFLLVPSFRKKQTHVNFCKTYCGSVHLGV